jgi:hypothetical protein
MALDLLGQETEDGLERMQDQMMQKRFTSRTREQVACFFPDMDLVTPGLVRAEEWRPDPGTANAGKSALWCAVGRKR